MPLQKGRVIHCERTCLRLSQTSSRLTLPQLEASDLSSLVATQSSVMRLIDISNLSQLKFVEVRDPSVVRYAILSHVWNKPNGNKAFTPEPTFKDLLSVMEHSLPLPEVPMWDKLRGFIRTASEDGHTLLWADMCCIDKTSSAEVDEAISSMYSWYLCAEVCYTYLKDVPSPPHMPDTLTPQRQPPPQFFQSIWFKRGWTLQELIASKSLIFVSSDWKFLGTKRGLSRIIQNITNIDVPVLTHKRKLHEVSVACRMSWAANRVTERVEDRAYSLMGLFGVHINVRYGEHEHAFIRLQEEIMRRIPDPTLLAWGPQRCLSMLPLDLSEHEHLSVMEATQTIHVRARRERLSSHPDWDPGYLLATSPDSFRQTAHLTKSAPQFGPVSIAQSRTVLRGGGPYKQKIIPFDMLQMHTPLVVLEERPTHSHTTASRTVSRLYYLIPLGCETTKAEQIALLLCPSTSGGGATASVSDKEHQHWVIGGRLGNSNNDTPDHCRIVTLPTHNDASGQASGALGQWAKALDAAPEREVYLPLSAPMDHWNAGDPRRTAVAEGLLCRNQGRFEIHLARWCKSAMEADGFTFDEHASGPKSSARVFTLFPPRSHTLYVKEGDQGVPVNAFEIVFSVCSPQCQGGEDKVFPLTGSITPYLAASYLSLTTPHTSPEERQRCAFCPAAAVDHLGTSETSGSWSFHNGVAVRTLQCHIGRPREKHAADQHVGGGFILSVALRALSTPHEPKTTVKSQVYLLEIEFHSIKATPPFSIPPSTVASSSNTPRRRIPRRTTSRTDHATNMLKVDVPGPSSTTPPVEPRADMSLTGSGKPTPTLSGH